MTITTDDVALWILQTAATAGTAAVGFLVLLPTKWGEKALSFYFDQKLSELRDRQNQEIEQVKEQLNHLSDRGKRSNEMEFGAIKSVWEKFVEAYLSTVTCAIAAIEHPDFTRMSNEEKEAFISGSNLAENDKDRLRAADDQNKEYVAITTWQQIAAAGREQHDLRLAIRKQRIFMPKQLSDKFMDAVAKLTGVYVQRKLGYQAPGMHAPFGGPIPEFLGSHEAMFDELCAAANQRLFRDEAREVPAEKMPQEEIRDRETLGAQRVEWVERSEIHHFDQL